jgi:hypothetical protein
MGMTGKTNLRSEPSKETRLSLVGILLGAQLGAVQVTDFHRLTQPRVQKRCAYEPFSFQLSSIVEINQGPAGLCR